MVLEDVEDKLVNDTQLHLVTTDDALVRGIVAVESNDPTFAGVLLERRVEKHVVRSVKPLRELLAAES